VRETFHSSLVLTEQVLAALGLPEPEIERTVATFREHDERLLVRQHAVYRDEKQLVQNAMQAALELQGILSEDRPEEVREAPPGQGLR
jgi:glutathione-regulated potassium-efflux system ancillary protein KefC